MSEFKNMCHDIMTAISSWALKYRPRRPVVKNKYHLSPSDIPKLKIVDRNKLREAPFVRNGSLFAWELAGRAGLDEQGIPVAAYHLLFKDNGSVILHFTGPEGLKSIESFYDRKDLHCPADLQIQEMFLKKINALIDAGVFVIGKESIHFRKKALNHPVSDVIEAVRGVAAF